MTEINVADKNNRLKVTVYSHYFRVSNIGWRFTDFVRRFERKYVQMGLDRVNRKWVRVEKKSFAFYSKDRSVYHFHINTLEEFKRHCIGAGVPSDLVEYQVMPLPPREDVELKIADGWAPREHQHGAIAFEMKDDGPINRLVALRPGDGKSFCTMYSASKCRARGIYFYKPSLIEKWVIDYRKTYDLDEGDLMTVQGSEELMALLEMARVGTLKAKIIAISNKTYQNYIKLYGEHGDGILEMGYACTPPDLFPFLKAAWRIIDEAHLDFHLNFMIDLFTHCERGISLSGTMFSDDDFITKMHNVAYPPASRYDEGLKDKYVDVQVALYSLAEPKKFKWADWASGRYSHNTYEQSLMKQHRSLDNYVRLIINQLDAKYMSARQPGDRALVFCASIDFCTVLANRLAQHYTDLRVERYVGSLNDPYENLITPDIAVSTHGSSGTAVDIPQLTTVIMTQSMRSSPGSVQNLGRLRKLPDGRAPSYTFVVCEDIPKHIEYHEHRQKLFEGRVASMRVDRTRMVI